MNEMLSRTSWLFPDIDAVGGRHVTLTRLNPHDDVDELYEASHGKEDYGAVWKYLHAGPFADTKSMHTWLLARNLRDADRFFCVASRELQRKVGMIGLMNISTEDGRAELGTIWYSPVVQRTKVNSEAVYLLLRHLFDELQYRRIEWKCDNRNDASKRAALRMGFTYEGLFRQHMVVKGRSRDTAWFAMVDAEWPRRKMNFERFLDAENISLSYLNSLESPERV